MLDSLTMSKERYVSPEMEILEVSFRDHILQVPSGGQFGEEQFPGSVLTEDPIVFL